jgi:hypothetical protein
VVRIGPKLHSAEALGINLASTKEQELFKWFLACLLFGKPIQRQVAERAYREFVRAGLVTPDAILSAGWDELVRLLDQAHYVRYDFSTATKLLEICSELKSHYGTVKNLLSQATNSPQLSAKLQEFKHVGPVTARLFLREVRPIWDRMQAGHRQKAQGTTEPPKTRC